MAEMWFLNSLDDVFRTSGRNLNGYEDKNEWTLNLAKNEMESFQVAVNAGDRTIKDVHAVIVSESEQNDIIFSTGSIELVPATHQSVNMGNRTIRCTLPGELPEYISPKPIKIVFRQTRSFLITAKTSSETKPGAYNYMVKIIFEDHANGNPDFLEAPLTVIVHNVTLRKACDSDYKYVNWINGCGINPFEMDSFIEMNEAVYGIKAYSDEWYELLGNYAMAIKNQRMNTLSVPLFELLYRDLKFDGDGNYNFDFTLFDRFIETFIKYGEVKYFTGMHLVMRTTATPEGKSTDWEDHLNAELITWTFVNDNGKAKLGWEKLSDEKAWIHLEKLLTALYNHLKAKNLDIYWMQHISDELDTQEQFEMIRKVYVSVKEWFPTIKCLDATRDKSLVTLGRTLDIHVPQIDVHDKRAEEYSEINNNGNEVWTYTCLKPQFNYMSRLDDFQLICTRLIHWYNYLHGVKGYLHWAWNFWQLGNVPNNPFADACLNEWPLDAWIVFPDIENRSVFETMRSHANTDGIEDYELLRICEEKNREKTRDIVSLLIGRANDFTLDTALFYRARKMLLKLASE